MTYEQKQAEKKLAQEKYIRNTEALNKIIKPLRTAKYECDFDFRYLRTALTGFEQDYGGLELDPDFQRGHVWTEFQQTHYIENILRGVVSSSGFLVQFNCPNWDNDDDEYSGDLPPGFQCIDGLQRITAVLDFIDGKVKPFGLNVDDLDYSAFSIRGSLHRFRIAVHNFQSKKELLQHYIDLNAGGTPHSKEELDRVRQMLNRNV